MPLALALMWNHFSKWQRDPDFQKPGNHTITLSLPSGPVKIPTVTLVSKPIVVPLFKFKVTFEVEEGGLPGRVFQLDYRIGGNAGLGNGRFFFRFDYLDFRTNPPTTFLHYHFGYSLNGQIQRGDHLPLYGEQHHASAEY